MSLDQPLSAEKREYIRKENKNCERSKTKFTRPRWRLRRRWDFERGLPNVSSTSNVAFKHAVMVSKKPNMARVHNFEHKLRWRVNEMKTAHMYVLKCFYQSYQQGSPNELRRTSLCWTHSICSLHTIWGNISKSWGATGDRACDIDLCTNFEAWRYDWEKMRVVGK